MNEQFAIAGWVISAAVIELRALLSDKVERGAFTHQTFRVSTKPKQICLELVILYSHLVTWLLDEHLGQPDSILIKERLRILIKSDCIRARIGGRQLLPVNLDVSINKRVDKIRDSEHEFAICSTNVCALGTDHVLLRVSSVHVLAESVRASYTFQSVITERT